MTTGLRRRWIGNSMANLVGGASAAAFALAVPALVSREMSGIAFSVWSLAMQMVAYISILGVGLQTATARFVAQAHERADIDDLRETARAAQSLGSGATVLALVSVVGLSLAYPALFPDVPATMIPSFRASLLAIGAGAALQLLALTPMGLFQGVHRNVTFVAMQVAVRAVAVVGIAWAVARHAAMHELAIVYAVTTSLLVPVVLFGARRWLPWSSIGWWRRPAWTPRLSELLGYCFTLSAWSVAMVVINTVGTIVVGRVDLPMAGTYAMAMLTATVVAGLLGAALTPLMTTASLLHATPEGRERLPALLLRSTTVSTLALNAMFTVVVMAYPSLIRWTAGPQAIETVGPVLVTVAAAHCLRNMGAPYSMLLLACGTHRRALHTIAIEGVASVLGALSLGHLFGARGVALGSLFASFMAIGSIVFITLRSTPELTPHPRRFVWRGLVRPTLAFLPVYAAIAWYRW